MEITVHLQGGLGNQLFQYAAGLAVKKCMGPEAKLWFVMPDKNPHNHLGHDYVSDLFTKGQMTMGNLPVSAYNQWYAFEPWWPHLIAKRGLTMYMFGYFQYLPALVDILPELRIDFIKALCIKTGLLYKPQFDTGFVHVRRGDYLKLPNYHWVQEASYYKKGMELIGLKRWLVFSDDLDWCREQPCFQGAIFADEKDELRALLVMISCCGGAVISNSSFSWWAAMFGANEFSGRVVYPELWLEREKPVLFPESWLSSSS